MKRLVLHNPLEVVISVHAIPAYEGLEITIGFSCMACNNLYGTVASMRVHWSIIHGGRAFIEGLNYHDIN